MNLSGPALAPPAGVTSNFDNPPNNNPLAIGVFATCASVATICIFMKAYASLWIARKVQIEEVLALCAYGCFWGALYAEIRLTQNPGFLVHQWNVRLGAMISVEYNVFLFGVFYSAVLPLLKTAILVEWCRMFAPIGRRSRGWFWWGCAVVISVQIMSGIGIVISLNLQCIPHRAIWDITIQSTSQCFELFKLQVGSSSIQLISDVAILILPQQVIWNLQMNWRKRLGVSIIFGFGLLACISAAFRLETTVKHGKAADAIWTLAPLAFWATAEMTCGFFIVSLPCIPKILKETGAADRLKNLFGVSAVNTSQQNWPSEPSSYKTNRGRLVGTTGSKDYYQLDPLKSTASESTEYLHHDVNESQSGLTGVARVKVKQDLHDDKYTRSYI